MSGVPDDKSLTINCTAHKCTFYRGSTVVLTLEKDMHTESYNHARQHHQKMMANRVKRAIDYTDDVYIPPSKQ
jgi:hypothetical protein